MNTYAPDKVEIWLDGVRVGVTGPMTVGVPQTFSPLMIDPSATITGTVTHFRANRKALRKLFGEPDPRRVKRDRNREQKAAQREAKGRNRSRT